MSAVKSLYWDEIETLPLGGEPQTRAVTVPFEAEIVFTDGEFDRIDLVTLVGSGVQKRTVLGWGDLSPKIRERLLEKFSSEIVAGVS